MCKQSTISKIAANSFLQITQNCADFYIILIVTHKIIDFLSNSVNVNEVHAQWNLYSGDTLKTKGSVPWRCPLDRGVPMERFRCNVYVLVQFYPWFKFSFLLSQTHYHTLPYTQKQKKRKFEPRIKLNHNIYSWLDVTRSWSPVVKSWVYFSTVAAGRPSGLVRGNQVLWDHKGNIGIII